jgi:hypothetical protein
MERLAYIMAASKERERVNDTYGKVLTTVKVGHLSLVNVLWTLPYRHTPNCDLLKPRHFSIQTSWQSKLTIVRFDISDNILDLATFQLVNMISLLSCSIYVLSHFYRSIALLENSVV